MGFTDSFTYPEPTRAQIDAWPGLVVLEFGTGWCGFCKAAQPHLESAFGGHPGVLHLKVEDGPGRRLGRSFGIKLWPTLIFIQDGRELSRLVRPSGAAAVAQALAQIGPLPRS